MAFRVAAAQCKKICPERLNWPGRLAGLKATVEFQNIFFKTTFHHHFKPKMVSNLRKIFLYCLALQTYSAYLQSMKKACENFGCRYLRFVELSFIIHVVLFFCIQYTNNIVWPFVTLLLQHMYTFTHCLP